MNISVKAEYALEAIFDLAAQTQGEPVKIADIARRQQIPQKFLELILASLKQGGFVESRRGAEGGYRLARAAEQITVGQVLRFIDESKKARRGGARRVSPVVETGGRGRGRRAGDYDVCRLGPALERIANALRPQLGDLSPPVLVIWFTPTIRSASDARL